MAGFFLYNSYIYMLPLIGIFNFGKKKVSVDLGPVRKEISCIPQSHVSTKSARQKKQNIGTEQ